LNHCAGEFGHNDFYPVVIAACQIKGLNGEIALRAMILSDEIRGRLAEVFSLKSYKIDHVVHGAISSAVVYGALLGANEEQIESALGMLIAHYIPWRAIRSGKELSDSKGSSAALSTEAAIISVHRAMKGFVGPKDIFRNKEAIFRYFQPNDSDESPFDIVLSHSGDDFAVMGMHFKLGLYEYQSASALHGLLKIISENPHEVLDFHSIKRIKIVAYEPAYGIIGDKSKWNPTNRQSADHSMVYIVSRKLMKAIQIGPEKISEIFKHEGIDGLWKALMLSPYDYSSEAISDGNTRSLMHRIEFVHGGPEYDLLYPEGIPTSIKLESSSGVSYDSGLIMFPAGHSLNSTSNLTAILTHKFQLLGKIALGNEQSSTAYLSNLSNLSQKSSNEVLDLYCAKVKFHPL
jgi:2-methylcitrate dehydratase